MPGKEGSLSKIPVVGRMGAFWKLIVGCACCSSLAMATLVLLLFFAIPAVFRATGGIPNNLYSNQGTGTDGGTEPGNGSSVITGPCAEQIVSLAEDAVGDPTSKYYPPDPRKACAAFVSTILKNAGILDRIIYTAQDLWDDTGGQIVIPKGGSLDLSVLKPGDVVYFKDTSNNGRYFTHVGIYIGNDRFINTSSTRQEVVNYSLTHYGHFAGAKRFCSD